MSPCQSRWSWVRLSTVAAVGSKPPRRRAGSWTAPAPTPRASAWHRASRQRVEQRGADVAGHGHRFARALHQLAGERGDRGLAVGAGDRQHRAHSRCGSASARQAWANRPSSPAPSPRLREPLSKQERLRGGSGPGCAARAHGGAFHQRRVEARRLTKRAMRAARLRSACQLGRRLAGVGHGHLRAATRRTSAPWPGPKCRPGPEPARAGRCRRVHGPTSASGWTGPPGTAAW
jgi:hypothetical protein